MTTTTLHRSLIEPPDWSVGKHVIHHTASSRIGQVEILAAKLLISALKMHNVWVVVGELLLLSCYYDCVAELDHNKNHLVLDE